MTLRTISRIAFLPRPPRTFPVSDPSGSPASASFVLEQPGSERSSACSEGRRRGAVIHGGVGILWKCGRSTPSSASPAVGRDRRGGRRPPAGRAERRGVWRDRRTRTVETAAAVVVVEVSKGGRIGGGGTRKTPSTAVVAATAAAAAAIFSGGGSAAAVILLFVVPPVSGLGRI